MQSVSAKPATPMPRAEQTEDTASTTAQAPRVDILTAALETNERLASSRPPRRPTKNPHDAAFAVGPDGATACSAMGMWVAAQRRNM